MNLPDLVRALVEDAHRIDNNPLHPNQPACGTPIEHVSGRISISTIAALRRPNALQAPDTALLCLTSANEACSLTSLTGTAGDSSTPKALYIPTPDGKKGQRHFLTTVLPRSMPFLQHHLLHHCTVCIACSTGTDMSVGVAVAALALFFRPDGSFCEQGNACDDLCTRRNV